MGSVFTDGFEDGTWSDNWNDHSETTHSPDVNTNRSYAGSYSLDLPSSAGTSTKNEVRSSSTWSGAGNEFSAQVNKYNDGGDHNSRNFGLVDSANPDRELVIYESSYPSNHLLFREKDTSGNVINEWVLNSTELGSGWYKHSITTDSGTVSASAGSHSVSSVTTTADWSTIDCRVKASCSGWGSGANIDIAVDSVNATEPDPAAPTNTSQSVVDDDTIDLSWTDNASNEDQYRIQVSEDGGTWSLVTTAAANTTAYTYTATVGTNEHRFRVRAENSGNSAWDYTATVATDPTALSVTGHTDTSIDLSWTGTRDESNYRVLRAQATGTTVADYTEVGVPTTTSFSDTGLENGEKYFYRVQSEYSGTNSQLTGEVSQITNLPAPALDSLDMSVEDEITVSYTLNDNSPDGQVDIFRSTDGTKGTVTHSDSTTPSTSSPTSHSWTDTSLADGETYHYTIDRNGDHATSTSSQLSGTTVLPAPSGLTSTVSADDISLSWTDNADNEDGYYVYRKPSSATSYTQIADLAANSTSYTDAGLLDGEEYDHYVEAYTEDAVSSSSVVISTTELADVTGLSGDASVEDQITLSWDDVTDYGDYHVQHRVTGSGNAYTDDGTVGEATTSMTITGLADGEQYDMRVRAETEHVSSAWLEITPVTLLPTPTALSAASVGTTSIDLSWTDNADSEDGTEIYRRDEYESGYTAYEQVDTVGASVSTFTDDTVSPSTTYEYYVSVFTEHITADSASMTTTTDGLGIGTSRAPARGWRVEIDHPNGQTLTPPVIDEAEHLPAINNLPRVKIPLRADESWLAANFEGAPIRVWKDGKRLAADRINSIELGPNTATIEAVGGGEFQNRITAEYEQKEAHLAVDDLITNQSPYVANVDNPASGTQSNIEMQSATTDQDFQDNLNAPIGATDPLEIINGGIQTLQTCWTEEGENSTGGSYTQRFTSSYSGNTDASGNAPAITLQSGSDYAYWDFTPAYTIPEADVGLHIRQHTPGTETPEIVYKLGVAGNALQEVDRLPYSGSIARLGSLSWRDQANNTFDSNGGWSGGDLQAGKTYRLRLDVATAANDPLAVDVVAPADNRHSYTFDNTVTSTSAGNALSGPELYPDAVEAVFEDSSTAKNVVGGQVDVSMTDTGNSQALYLSNDQGASYTSSSNTSSYSTSFGTAGSYIRTKVTLSRHGSQTSTPTDGVSPQKLDSYTLYADLEDSPVLIDKTYDNQFIDVLKSIADYGNFVFEIHYDESQDTTVVEWTQPGQRTGSAATSLVNYEFTKDIGAVYDQAIIYGAKQNVTNEAFTSNHGSFVNLNNANFIEVSEIVKTTDGATTFDRGSDYVMDNVNGQIKTLSGGGMTDATTYHISYGYKTEGRYPADSNVGSDPQQVVRTIPSITSSRGCDQAALYLIERVKNPMFEATVTVPRDQLALDLVTAQQFDALPSDEYLVRRNIQEGPSEARLTLGSRRTVDEIVADLQARLSATAERV